MAWSVLQSVSHNTAGTPATTNTTTYTTANITSGSKIIAVAASDSAGATTSGCTVGGTAMTKVAEISGATGGDVDVSLWALDAPAGVVGTKPSVVITWNTSTNSSILAQEVSGLLAGNTSAMWDGTPATLQATTVLGGQSQPAYTSTAANEYLVAVFGDNGGPETYTVPSGYTGDTNGVNGNSFDDLTVAYKNSANGAETGTWTFTGTATGAGYIVVAFKIAAVAAVSGTAPLHLVVARRNTARSVVQFIPVETTNPASVPGTPRPPQYQILGRSTGRLAETYRFSIQPGG